MNYKDFFKKNKNIQNLIPEGVNKKEFYKGLTLEIEQCGGDEVLAAKITGNNLIQDPQFYSITSDVDDDENVSDYNLGGELSSVTNGISVEVDNNDDSGGVPVNSNNDKETITAGGKKLDNAIVSKSVGGNIVPGEGQKQGGLNTKGSISSTPKLNENKKSKVHKIVKRILEEITFDEKSNKWIKIINEKKNNSYKNYNDEIIEPEIMEMYSNETECLMNERYVELVTAKKILTESELGELKKLREKIDYISILREHENPEDSKERRDYQKRISQYNNKNFNKRFPCPTCKTPDALNAYQHKRGYQCDKCADMEEGPMQEGDGNWIQKAINPSHKGYCTPMSKSTCTPKRKALAKRFKDGEINEDSKSTSKISKTIKKGMKPKTMTKTPKMKFQPTKRTTSGVHKRKP